MPSSDVATVDASAPLLNVYKQGFVVGDDFQFRRTITGLLGPPNQAQDVPMSAWLTIKSSPAVPDGSGIQSAITTVASGQGVIVGTLCTFNMGALQTSQLRAGPLYYYSIKVQVTPSNNVYSVEQGWIQFDPEVTDAPAATPTPYVPPAIPKVLYGPNPPPNGPQDIGTHYWVVPPVEGFPAEWVFASSGFWRVTSVVSFGD